MELALTLIQTHITRSMSACVGGCRPIDLNFLSIPPPKCEYKDEGIPFHVT